MGGLWTRTSAQWGSRQGNDRDHICVSRGRFYSLPHYAGPSISTCLQEKFLSLTLICSQVVFLFGLSCLFPPRIEGWSTFEGTRAWVIIRLTSAQGSDEADVCQVIWMRSPLLPFKYVPLFLQRGCVCMFWVGFFFFFVVILVTI